MCSKKEDICILPDFSSKVVLVTGGSSGIGEGIAMVFAKHGAKLAIGGRNQEKLEKVAAACRQLRNQEVLTIKADLSTDEGCQEVANKTLQYFGRLDVLVNNAGLGGEATIQNTDMASYDRIMAVNARAVYNLTRLLVPALIQSKGNIVNISSTSGFKPSVGCLHYNMSKAALDMFTRCVALELAPKGVRVNSVNPGFTKSSLLPRITGMTEDQYADFLEDVRQTLPIPHILTGEEIGRAVIALVDPEMPGLTGAVLPVDSGAGLSTAAMSINIKQDL